MGCIPSNVIDGGAALIEPSPVSQRRVDESADKIASISESERGVRWAFLIPNEIREKDAGGKLSSSEAITAAARCRGGELKGFIWVYSHPASPLIVAAAPRDDSRIPSLELLPIGHGPRIRPRPRLSSAELALKCV